MKAIKIKHKNEDRIKVDFPFDRENVQKIRQIPDAKWSESQNAWHIPYAKAAFEMLKKIFPEVEYLTKTASETPAVLAIIKSPDRACEISTEVKQITPKTSNYIKHTGVSILVFEKNIAIKIPKNDLDTQFILSLRYSRWDSKKWCWIVPNYSRNLDLIKSYFKERITELVVHEKIETCITVDERRIIKKNDLLIIKSIGGRLKLIFGFNRELTKAIKTIPYFSWDQKHKYWSIPFGVRFIFWGASVLSK